MSRTRKNYRPVSDASSYHVHLYYDGRSKQHAGNLRREMAHLFGDKIDIGRWRDKAPQGPHPVSHFQVAFDRDVFPDIVNIAFDRGDEELAFAAALSIGLLHVRFEKGHG